MCLCEDEVRELLNVNERTGRLEGVFGEPLLSMTGGYCVGCVRKSGRR